MTKIKITVAKPASFGGVHTAIKMLPFGLCTDTHAYPENGNFVIELTGKRKEQAFEAATSFIGLVPELDVLACVEKTGKRETDLLSQLG